MSNQGTGDGAPEAAKWEAIGRLSTGIAHDFNNILTSLKGYSELLMEGLPDESPFRRHAERIHKAATRASVLIHQLLSLSRRQVFDPRPVQLNTLFEQLLPVLARLLGADISIQTTFDSTLPPVMADAGEVQQLMLALAVRAREAMPVGGVLRISTERDGTSARVVVADSGGELGERETPFGPSRGKGISLMSFEEMIRQSGGTFESSGTGSENRLTISLPGLVDLDGGVPSDRAARTLSSQTVLVVEDDEAVLEFVVFILGKRGYQVLSADNAYKAQDLFVEHGKPIDLLLVDVVMPNVNGTVLAEKLSQLQPRMKVLFMSGYPGDSVDRFGAVSGSGRYLQKPFSPEALIEKVTALLNES